MSLENVIDLFENIHKNCLSYLNNFSNLINNNNFLYNKNNKDKIKILILNLRLSLQQILNIYNKNIKTYENMLIKYENDIRFYIKNYYKINLKKELIENKMNSLQKKEKEYESLKKLTNCYLKNGEFIFVDNKDNAINILRMENSNLKKTINELENKINNLNDINFNNKKTIDELKNNSNSSINININDISNSNLIINNTVNSPNENKKKLLNKIKPFLKKQKKHFSPLNKLTIKTNLFRNSNSHLKFYSDLNTTRKKKSIDLNLKNKNIANVNSFKMINKNNIQNNKIINQNKIIKRNIKNIINVDLLNNINNNQMINKSIKNLFIKKNNFQNFLTSFHNHTSTNSFINNSNENSLSKSNKGCKTLRNSFKENSIKSKYKKRIISKK